MSDLIEQLKKSEKLCKDTYSESTIITRLTLKRIISALEELAKEPQSSETDLISKKTLIEEVSKELFTVNTREYGNIDVIDINNLTDIIDNQPQVQPIVRSVRKR